MTDVNYIRGVVKLLILSLLEQDASPQDIIEGFEEELDRYESLVFDYE
jgi:hypothetical protein